MKRWYLIVALFVIVSASEAQGQTVRFLAVGYTAELLNYLQDSVVPGFEAEHGADVSVESTSWGGRTDKILVSVAGGVPYDVVVTGFYSPYAEGSQGLLAPLDDYLDRWEHTSKFPQPVWEAMRWKGTTYVVPQNIGIRAIAYNKDLFATSGLDPEGPPENWDELIAAARALTRVEGDHVVLRGWDFSGNASQDYLWFVRQAGISPIDLEQFASNLDQPEALEALHAIADLSEASAVNLPGDGGRFAQGDIAMDWHNPTLFVRAVEENPDVVNHYGIFAPRRSPEHERVAYTYIDGLAILVASSQKDLAWHWIARLYAEDALLNAYQLGGLFPGRIDMVEAISEIHPKIGLFYDVFPYVQSPIIPPPRNTSQGELRRLVEQVYHGQISPEEALIMADELWDRLLGEWRTSLGNP